METPINGNSDYGGILKATHPVLSIMEEQGIRSSWFVERHADYPEHHTPGLFPEIIREIAERSHEIGVHIHWTRRNRNGWIYPVRNKGWVKSMLIHARIGVPRNGWSVAAWREGTSSLSYN